MSSTAYRLRQSLNLVARYQLGRLELVVSALLGAAFAIALGFVTTPMAALLAGYLMFSMFLVMLIDARHFIIPDVLSLPAIPLGLLAAVLAFPGPAETVFINHAAAAAVASGSLYGVRLLYHRMRGSEGLGLGDVKLAAAAGAWVGLGGLAITCLLACCAALLAVLIKRLTSRSSALGLQTPVPFGSFIAPAIVIIWFFQLFLE